MYFFIYLFLICTFSFLLVSFIFSVHIHVSAVKLSRPLRESLLLTRLPGTLSTVIDTDRLHISVTDSCGQTLIDVCSFPSLL